MGAGRNWIVRPLMSHTLHVTPSGNPLKTLCGIRFASIRDYEVPMGRVGGPTCRTCERILQRLEERLCTK